MKRLSSIAVIVFLAFAFITCDENGGGGGSVSEVIGPEGGTITSRDGRLTLTFPPGALSEDTEITIKDINPGDLPPEFDGFDSQFAYVLEPDGIEFNAPVTASFLTDEEPVQDDGSLSTEGTLLLTSLNGEIEVLENLTQDVNADENVTTVSGELSHFSDLLALGIGIDVSVSGVPDSLPVGSTFNALVRVEAALLIAVLNEEPQYSDASVSPIVRMFEPDTVVIPFTDPFNMIAQRSLTYRCDAPGTGDYIAQVIVDFTVFREVEDPLPPKEPLDLSDYLVIPLKSITCESQPGPSPQPTPQPTEPPIEVCAELGFYESMSAGCGIGMFTLSNITGEGNLVVSGFGENLTNVTFNKTDLPTVFESANMNLIIFGQEGHTCTLTCGPSSNQLTLECERPGAMCTEVFTLQQ